MGKHDWKDIKPDSSYGANTLRAIKRVQKDLVKMSHPDGLVSPKGTP